MTNFDKWKIEAHKRLDNMTPLEAVSYIMDEGDDCRWCVANFTTEDNCIDTDCEEGIKAFLEQEVEDE